MKKYILLTIALVMLAVNSKGQEKDGELTVKIRGACGDENLRLAVKDNAVSVTEYDGEAEFEFDRLAAVRAFFSNYPSDRAEFPPEGRQWLPLPMYFSSRDTM